MQISVNILLCCAFPQVYQMYLHFLLSVCRNVLPYSYT
uniref:BLTX371 n=1 Tax=Nephila pilipes TaxID=299642 RepID=A0A076KZF6_NEPPI|nr:BLTX371 [Nephila pilipes]